MHRLLITFIFCVCSWSCYAQDGIYDSEKNTETPDVYQGESKYSDTVLTPHIYLLSTDSQRVWKEARAYRYHKNLGNQLKAWKEKNKKFSARSKFKSRTWFDKLIASGFFKFLLWVIAGGFVAFILFKLVLNRGMFEGRKNSRVKHLNDLSDEPELTKNFDVLILKAESDNDLRSAIRYNFLALLKHLNDQSLIIYNKDKTNNNYLNELPPNLKTEFRSLSRFYEFAWYGNIAFSAKQYTDIKTRYSEFSNLIKGS